MWQDALQRIRTPDTVAGYGTVVDRIRPRRQLPGTAFLSCANTVFINEDEHHLTAAVLLNAGHPGARPARIPGMAPLSGHPGTFVAPASEGELVARQVDDAWLVVEEEDEIGVGVPLKLLEDLRMKIRR